MKSKAGKILKSTLAASFAFSLVTANPVQILAAPQESNDVKVDVYPKPQEITYTSGEGMSLVGEVNVVIHGEQESATLPKLEKILKENGISYTISDEIDDSKANILISSTSDHCDECAENLGGNVEALSEEQGYILSANNDTNEKGEIKIIGADSDGAYYGLMTLTQMLEQKTEDNKIAETVISDYPSVKLRGFVEGFYGYPWSFEDRLSLMSESSDFKMNTYIYAPKDDPYHKDRWRELYPNDKAEELRQLAAEGKKDNMSFCWSVHPGNGFSYNTDDDYNALINKFEQLYNLGVRQFGISYDDLGGYVNGQQHADLINRVNREWVKIKGDVDPLIVVGTRYCNGWGPSMSSYFKPFFGTLDDDVVVMWTGANTMSAITKDAYEWPKTQTGVTDKNLAAWWNYPVNDYCDGNLMMSPLENLDTDVDNLSGFFLNPMSQAEASKVAIFSGADYSWNVSGFERTSSWVRAIDELVPEASESFQRFADNISYIKDGFEFDESRYLVDTIEAFKTALQNKEGIVEAATALKTEFTTMKNDVDVLRNIEDKNLYEEIEQHLNAYEAVAEAGISSMQAFIDAENGDVDA
ncbi:MAG: beta-N-acetylglucosaminidase domain-containing protein, partial [Thomasclavelia sp.]|nr:beta-N-acetylglucosaminidase domain-containing protein [Thomasclavelia sp.]